MEKKQTAVEWLIAELQRLPLEHRLEKAHLFYHAKQMEKEQINKAFYDGYYQEELYDAREYYNDTYNKAK